MTSSVRPGRIRIGGVSVPIGTALQWVTDYTNVENTTAPNPYAYPAYDHYDRERNDPRRLSDADLIAPGLLNVPVKIRSYYRGPATMTCNGSAPSWRLGWRMMTSTYLWPT
jgi:hypothetical protein